MKSPCKKICDADQNLKVCKTCGRSFQEISDWPLLKHEEKKNIIKKIKKDKNESKIL